MSSQLGQFQLGAAQLGAPAQADFPSAPPLEGSGLPVAISQLGWFWLGEAQLGSTSGYRPSFVLSPANVAVTGTLSVAASGSNTSWTPTTNPFSIVSGPAINLRNAVYSSPIRYSFDLTVTTINGQPIVIADATTGSQYSIQATLGQLALTLSVTHARVGVPVTVSVTLENASTTSNVTLAASLVGTWSSNVATLSVASPSANRVFTPTATGPVVFTATGDNGVTAASPESYYSDGLIYYVSAAGNDASNGQSESTPFLTIAEALTYSGGDWLRGATYNFRGGDIFSNVSITVDDGNDGSDIADLITFQSYGTGRAEFFATSGTPFVVSNCGAVKLNNIKLRGNGNSPATTAQAIVYVVVTDSSVIRNVLVTNNEIMNGSYGFLSICAVAGETVGLTVSGNYIHGIHAAGLILMNSPFADPVLPHTDSVVRGNTIADIDRAVGSGASGQSIGIFLIGTDGALFEQNLVYDIGATAAVGGGALVTAVTNAATICGNEVYNCFGPIGQDATGLDVDFASTNCLVEYNYVHDCDGAGLAAFENGPGLHPVGLPTWNGNVFRYNVIQNCAKTHFGLFLWIGDLLVNGQVYGNTFVVANNGLGTGNRVFYAYDAVDGGGPAGPNPPSNMSGWKILNNIVLGSTGAVKIVDIGAAITGTSAADFEWKNNDFYTNAGNESITYPTGNYTTVSAWQTANSGTMAGNIHVNPALNDPFTSVVYNNPPGITALDKVTPTSSGAPGVNAGINIAAAPFNYVVTHDYSGGLVPNGAAFDIGAIEFGASPIAASPARVMYQRRLNSK